MTYEATTNPEQHDVSLDRRTVLAHGESLVAQAMVRNYLTALTVAMQAHDSDAIALGQYYGIAMPEQPAEQSSIPAAAIIDQSIEQAAPSEGGLADAAA